MSNDVTKMPKNVAPAGQTQGVESRLKHDLMEDALQRMFGKETEKPIAPGTPRVLLALANHAHSPGWERAKTLQRQIFEAAASSGLEMKFAFYGEDDDRGVRRCRITRDWKTNPDAMDSVMDRAECSCGCYVNIRSVLQQAVKENKDRPMSAVVISGDVFHDDEDSLAEAALAVIQLRRKGTRVFLIQQGDDPVTARKLQYLQVCGAAFFRFDPKTQQQQFAQMLESVSAYAAGGEEAVKATGGEAAILLLEHLKQPAMPILSEENERIARDQLTKVLRSNS